MPVRRLVIQGLVQGVGFRWWLRRAAEGLSLDGWVTNLPDGSVAVVASGAEENLRSLEDLCRSGPSGASVEDVASLPAEGPVDKGFRVIV